MTSLVLFLVLACTTVSAAYFDVNQCASSVNCLHVSPDGNDGNIGTLASPLKTIPQAMNMAITRTPVTIVLNDGIYSGGITWPASNISLTSRNGAAYTFIDGNLTTYGLHVDVESNSNTLVISGITVRRCSDGRFGGMVILGEKTSPLLKDMIISDSVAPAGAGIFINLAYPVMMNLSIINNLGRQGGGLAVISSIQPVIMKNCLVTNNTSPGSSGGGVEVQMSEFQAYNSTFSSNSAVQGGGLYSDSSIMILRDCLILANTATYDDSGGMYTIRSIVAINDTVFRANYGFAKGAGLKSFLSYHGALRDNKRFPYDLTMYRVTFDSNYGQTDGILNVKDFITAYIEDLVMINNKCPANGAGFFVGSNANVIIVRGKFIKSTGSDFGGGLLVSGAPSVICKQCEFTQNTGTADGGGAAADKKSYLQLIDPIFNGNTAGGNGGGLACIGKSTCDIVRGVFINNNATLDGGGIHGLTSKMTINATTFINNVARVGVGINVGVTTTATVGYSTFQGDSGTAGNIYFVDSALAPSPAKLATNTFMDATTQYGNQFATSPSQLSFLNDGDVVTSTQYTPGTTVVNSMNMTIMNVATFSMRIVLMDQYMQRVATSQADTSDIFVAITPMVNTSTTQSATLVNLPRIRMPAGLATFNLAVAGQLGGTYLMTFSSSIVGVANAQLMVNIEPCGDLDYITYYPPGSTTYQVCNPATPKYMSSAMFAVITVLCVVSMICVAIVQGYTFYYWQTPIFKGSTPSFMSLLLLGSIIGYIAIILENIDVDRTSSGLTMFTQVCQTTIWLLSISFSLMFGTLAIKNWRIYRIFCNDKLHAIRNKVATSHLFIRLLLLLCGELLINLIFHVYDPLQGKLKIFGTNYSATCYSKSSDAYLATMLGYNGLIALGCVILAYRTRDVNSRFNESRQLMGASYNMFVALIVVVVLTLTLPDIQAQRAAFSFGSWFIITSTWAILYLPKLFLAIFQAQRNISSKDAHTMPGGGSAGKTTNNKNSGNHSGENNTSGGLTTGTNTPSVTTPKMSSQQLRRSTQSKNMPPTPHRISLAMSLPSHSPPLQGIANIMPPNSSPPLSGLAQPLVTTSATSSPPLHPLPPPPPPSYPSQHGNAPYNVSTPSSTLRGVTAVPTPIGQRSFPLLDKRSSSSSHLSNYPGATSPHTNSQAHLHYMTDSANATLIEPPALSLAGLENPISSSAGASAYGSAAGSPMTGKRHIGGASNFV